MRYITPEILIRKRAGDNPLPEWSAAILCFHGPVNSQMLVQQFDARALGYSVFTGIAESDVYETVIAGKRVGILAKSLSENLDL